MNRSLHIAIADADSATRWNLAQTLERLGHRVTVTSEAAELVEVCSATDISLLMIDISTSHIDGLRTVEQIYQRRPVPVIIVSNHLQPEEIDSAASNHVFAFLTKPIKDSDLAPAIEVAKGRFSEIQALRGELESVRSALNDRKIIERAKGILMRQSGVDEETAFKSLQKLARSKSKKIAEIADMIVTAKEATDSIERRK